MKNYAKKSIVRDGSASTPFVVPAGVRSLSVSFLEEFSNKKNSYYPTILIDEYGRVLSWGANNNGQVGNGNVANQILATHLIGQTWKAPFLRADGQMVNMGLNSSGQIGDGTTIPKSTPTLVAGGHRFKKIVRGSTTCLGLTETGNLYAWGSNIHGQLGDGTTIPKSTPVQVMPGTTFVDFWTDTGQGEITGASYPQTVFAKDSNNQTWAWGRDPLPTGVLGTGVLGSSSTPTLIPGSLNFTKIALSTSSLVNGFAVGMTDTGAVYAWGNNAFGQLGDNTVVSKTTPTLAIGGHLFADVGAGDTHAGGLTKDGVVYTWGNNSSGQLGHGGVFPKSSPTVVTGIASGCKQLAVGTNANFVIDGNRQLYAWGFQNAGTPLLGSGDSNPRSTPNLVNPIGAYGLAEVIVEPLNSVFVQVVMSTGSRYAWGANGAAQGNLGINLVAATYNTAQVGAASNFIAQVIATGTALYKKPEIKTITRSFSVLPGQSITIAHQTSGFVIPELGIESSRYCNEVVLEWEG